MKHPPTYRPLLQRARELRQLQTQAEQLLWKLLRNRRLASYKFRRQHPIGRFIVDFFCHECSLVIEIDGPTHGLQIAYDQARTDWLNEHGYTVIRFSNEQVLQQTEAVLEAIFEQCKTLAEDKPSP